METPKPALPLAAALPLLGAAALAAWGTVTKDAAAATEANFLALLVAGVGTAVAALGSRSGWAAAGGTLAALLAGLATVPGPARGAAVTVALAFALAVAAARALPRALALEGGDADVRRAVAALVPLALGLQLLARGGVLLAPPGLGRTAVVLVALPAVAALALAALAREVGGVRALGSGGALFAVGGGFWPGTVLALAALALGVRLRGDLGVAGLLRALALLGCFGLLALQAPRLGGVSLAVGVILLVVPARAWLGASLGILAVAVALAAGYPWLRPQPLAALAAVPGMLLERAQPLLGDGPPLELDAEAPVFSRELTAPRRARRVAVESSLAVAAGVPAGTPVATLALRGTAGEHEELLLRVGAETGEWAARRPGVAAPAPAPWVAWVDPGRFFGQRYRASWDLESPFTVERVELRRRPDLPAEVELHLFQLELVR